MALVNLASVGTYILFMYVDWRRMLSFQFKFIIFVKIVQPLEVQKRCFESK